MLVLRMIQKAYKAYTIFFETKEKYLPHRLIKQKRIAQLINGKPGENQHMWPVREKRPGDSASDNYCASDN